MSDWGGEARGAGLVGLLVLAVLALAELWARVGRPEPEWTRKLVHLAGGLVCLAFPFVLESPWVVLAMALGLSALFTLGGKLGFLRSLHGVARRSRGSEYYPLAISLVFLMTPREPWLYVSSVLVLAVADALAALIGGRYGAIRYEVEDETKSLEGSLVFLVVAFLAIHLPLLLMTDLPRGTCVLAASLVAALVTGFEAISLHGADNLLVPLACCVVLQKIIQKPLAEIAYQNLSLLGICAAVAIAVQRVRSFNVGGSIAFILFAYGAWSLGSELWAAPVFAGFAAYAAFAFLSLREGAQGAPVRVSLITRALLVPFLLVAAANATDSYGFCFGPYLAACSAVLSFSLWNHTLERKERAGGRRVVAVLSVASLAWALAAGVPWLLRPATPASAPLALALLSLPLALLDDLLAGRRAAAGAGERWPLARFVLALAAAGVIAGLEGLGLLPEWRLE